MGRGVEVRVVRARRFFRWEGWVGGWVGGCVDNVDNVEGAPYEILDVFFLRPSSSLYRS